MILSIIIPVYNVESYLHECLDSIVHSTLDQEQYEVILVNDGSTDKSYQIALSYQSKFKHFKCFDQTNKGVSITRNFALQQAQGKCVFFLDSDDHFKSNSLQVLADTIQSMPSADVFLFDKNYVKQPTNYTSDQLISEHFFSAYLRKACFRNEFLKQQQLQFLEGYILEDGIFILEAVLKAQFIILQSLDLVHYTDNPTSYMRDTSNKEKNQKMVQSFVHVIKVYHNIIEQYKSQLSDLSVQHLKLRKESFVFFLISRMIQFGYSSKAIYKELQQVGFSKFEYFPGKFYPSAQFKILSKVFEHSIGRAALTFLYSFKK